MGPVCELQCVCVFACWSTCMGLHISETLLTCTQWVCLRSPGMENLLTELIGCKGRCVYVLLVGLGVCVVSLNSISCTWSGSLIKLCNLLYETTADQLPGVMTAHTYTQTHLCCWPWQQAPCSPRGQYSPSHTWYPQVAVSKVSSYSRKNKAFAPTEVFEFAAGILERW